MAALLTGLSPQARRNRFHGGVNFSAAQLARWTQVDSERQLALVVMACVNSAERLIAEARYGVDDDRCGAEFALVVDVRWQRRGVGAWAMRSLQHAAAHSVLQWLQGDVLAGNAPSLGLMRRCGFVLSPDPDDDGLVQAQRRLWPNEGDAPPLHLQRSVRSWLRLPLWRVTAVTAITAR